MPPTSGHFGVLREMLTVTNARAFENAETKTVAMKILAGPFIRRQNLNTLSERGYTCSLRTNTIPNSVVQARTMAPPLEIDR